MYSPWMLYMYCPAKADGFVLFSIARQIWAPSPARFRLKDHQADCSSVFRDKGPHHEVDTVVWYKGNNKFRRAKIGVWQSVVPLYRGLVARFAVDIRIRYSNFICPALFHIRGGGAPNCSSQTGVMSLKIDHDDLLFPFNRKHD